MSFKLLFFINLYKPLVKFILTGTLICLVSTVNASLSDGLVAYYPFSGNANDATTNSNNGVVIGGANLIEDRFGNVDSAYDFDGAG